MGGRPHLHLLVLCFHIVPSQLSPLHAKTVWKAELRTPWTLRASLISSYSLHTSRRRKCKLPKISCASFWVIPEGEASPNGQNSFHGITIIGNRQTRRRRASRTIPDQPFSNPLVLSSLQKLRNVLYGLTEEHRQLDKEIERAQAQTLSSLPPPPPHLQFHTRHLDRHLRRVQFRQVW